LQKCQRLAIRCCPGFGQDGVNFHQEPGGNTAGRADPNWLNRARYSIPWDTMLGSGWGELGGGKAVATRERAAAVRESGSLRSAVRVVYCPDLYRCCSCFPFVCCSVKLPLSRPTSFCLFLSVLLRTVARGGAAERPRGAFVAGHSQTI